MNSNSFINYSLAGINLSYNILGVKLTNYIINKSVGNLFTSGETIETLTEDIQALEKRNIFGVGHLVVEGIEVIDEKYI